VAIPVGTDKQYLYFPEYGSNTFIGAGQAEGFFRNMNEPSTVVDDQGYRQPNPAGWTTRPTENVYQPPAGSSDDPAGDGGGGWGGYGGYGGSGAGPGTRNRYNDMFIYYFGEGKYNPGWVDRAMNEQWTDDMMRRYAVDQDARGPGAMQIRDYIAVELRKSIPDNAKGTWLVDAIMKDGTFENASYFEDTYIPNLAGWSVTQDPHWGQVSDLWFQATGTAPSWTMQQWVHDQVRQNGWDYVYDVFPTWLKGTSSAKSGPYGAAIREGIRENVSHYLGRAATEDELKADGKLWSIVSTGQAGQSAFMEYIRTQPEYATAFAGKPAGMTEDEYLQKKPGLDYAYWRIYGGPLDFVGVADNQPGQAPKAAPTDWLNYALENDLSYEQIIQDAAWLEDRDYLRGTLNPIMERTMGAGFTEDELWKIVSGGAGSGELRLRALEANNRAAYDEVFMDYTGHRPTDDDYEFLMNNFVSPQQYARRTAARESAVSMLEDVNRLLTDTLGIQVTVEDLENMAMGGQGSGALRSTLNQAERLSAFIPALDQYYGHPPTPEELAQYVGYHSPQQLVHDIETKELIAEMSPEIQSLFQETLGYTLSDDDLQTLYGQEQGYGALRAELHKAEKIKGEKEQATADKRYQPRVDVGFKQSVQGGIQTAMPTLGTVTLN
jgi:hypothetical protein